MLLFLVTFFQYIFFVIFSKVKQLVGIYEKHVN